MLQATVPTSHLDIASELEKLKTYEELYPKRELILDFGRILVGIRHTMSNDSKPKVLLIDDEKFLLEIYSIKFLRSGFDVYACTSADEGTIAIQRGYKPDVILFDITMPIKNGYQFLEDLERLHLAKKALKIALTNENQIAEMGRTKELGAHAHLVKAKYTPAELAALVSSMLKNR